MYIILMSLPTKENILINTGLVTSDQKYAEAYDAQAKRYDIGEYMDVLATIYSLKPLAALNIMHKKYIKNPGVDEVKKMVKEYGLRRFTKVRNNKTHYLNTVYFHPDNIENAKKLMAILWCNVVDESHKEYMIGKLLGYNEESIVAFYMRNYGVKLTNADIKSMNDELDKMVIRQILLDQHDIRLF